MSLATAIFNSMYCKMRAFDTEAAMLANSHKRLGLVNQAMQQVSFGSGLSNMRAFAEKDSNLEQQKLIYEMLYPMYKQLGASCDELATSEIKRSKLNFLA